MNHSKSHSKEVRPHGDVWTHVPEKNVPVPLRLPSADAINTANGNACPQSFDSTGNRMATQNKAPSSRLRQVAPISQPAVCANTMPDLSQAELTMNVNQQTTGTRWSRRIVNWCLAGLVAASGIVNPIRATAQDMPAGPEGSSNIQYTLPYNEYSGVAGNPNFQYGTPANGYTNSIEEPPVVGGFGIKGRAGHEAGSTVGREQSISYFDLSPYIFHENWVLFSEGRLGIGNNGKASGSLGGGVRRYLPRIDTIIGVSGWYDADGTRGPSFEQWGISGEILSEFIDFRTNWYVPYGETYKIVDQRFEPGSQRFIDRPLADMAPGDVTQGSYLAFQRRIFTATAMRGFDALFTVPVPGELAQKLNMEASAGFYHYNVEDDSLDDVWGWRARMDVDLVERLSHMFLEVTHDRTFKTNVVFGVDINYWGNLGSRPRVGHSQYNRLADWVRRNRTVVAYEGSFLDDPETAINPNTGNPYLIYQVNSNNPGGTSGTTSDPFGDLQTAINAAGVGTPADIVFVHGNSVFNTPITINRDGLQVIGEQMNPTIGVPVAGLSDNVLLPTVTPGAFNTPLIENVVGASAVTLAANNVRFAGFNIDNITGGNGIEAIGRTFGGGGLANTIDTVTISNVSGGSGIYLEDISGTMILNDVRIENVEGDMFHAERGNANINFTGSNNHFDNTANTFGAHGYAVQLIDTAGSIDMSRVLIEDGPGGAGLRVVGMVTQPSTANISFGDVSIVGATPLVAGEGDVHIGDFNGSVTFAGNLLIDNLSSGAGDAFVIRNLAPVAGLPRSGIVSVLGNTSILNRQGTAILVENLVSAAGRNPQVLFSGPVNIGTMGTGYVGTDAAIKFASASGELSFSNLVTINGSNGDGIQITDILDDGSTQFGLFQSSQLITINNVRGTSVNINNIQKENFRVLMGDLAINGRGFSGSTGTQGAGIRIFDYAGEARFTGTTTINNQNNSNAIAVDIQTNNATLTRTSGSVGFSTINVVNQTGAGSFGVRALNNGNTAGISLGTVNVQSTGAQGVLLRDNTLVSISGGSISSTGARAITVDSSPTRPVPQNHSVTLGSVTASGSDYGIFVENSLGSFTVLGNGSVNGDGGTISNMTQAGAYFRNVLNATDMFDVTEQTVDLRNMNFNGNVRGIEAYNMAQDNSFVNLSGLSINASGGEAIYMQDVRTFLLSDSNLTNNGATLGREQVEFRVFTPLTTGAYTVDIRGNNFTDSLTANAGGANMIYIVADSTMPSGTTLDLFFENNGIPGDATSTDSVSMNRSSGASALAVDWRGQANGTIRNNVFSLAGGTGQTAIELLVDGNGDFLVENNTISAIGAGATGVAGLFTGSSIIALRNNGLTDENGNFINNTGMLFSGLGSTGVDLTFLSSGNTIEMTNNLIQFTGTGHAGTGVRFSRIFGTNGDTVVRLNGNYIELNPLYNSTVTFVERGYHFVDTRGIITLQGGNNTVFPPTNAPWIYDFIGLSSAQTNGTSVTINGNSYPF